MKLSEVHDELVKNHLDFPFQSRDINYLGAKGPLPAARARSRGHGDGHKFHCVNDTRNLVLGQRSLIVLTTDHVESDLRDTETIPGGISTLIIGGVEGRGGT